MKKIMVILLMCGMAYQSKAQSAEVQQLILNYEKLSQY